MSQGGANNLIFSTSGAIFTIDGDSGSVIPTVGTVTITGGGTGLTTSGAVSTLSLTGTLNVTHGGTGTSTAFTEGSVVFTGASGIYNQDNSNFFWDDTNNFLGLGMNTPHGVLQFAASDALRKIVLSEFVNNDYQTYSLGVDSNQLVYNVPTASNAHSFYYGTSAVAHSLIGQFIDSQFQLTGSNYINFGFDLVKEINAGKMGYQLFSGGLDIVGAGAATPRAITLYDNVGITQDLNVAGNITKGGGGFLIDHPSDPLNKLLYHSFVEAPERTNIYSGITTCNNLGIATVTMPSYFSDLNTSFKYQLTCIGAYAPVFIQSGIADNKFVIAGGLNNLQVSWQVTAVRNDPWAIENILNVEVNKTGGKVGNYIHPTSYGQAANYGA